MKAGEIKRIKINAEQSRTEHKHYLKEQARQQRLLETQERKTKEETLQKFNQIFVTLNNELQKIRKNIVVAISEGNSYIGFEKSVPDLISSLILSANEIGQGQLEKEPIYLPPLLTPFKHDDGYGILNPKILEKNTKKRLMKLEIK